jgi:hypothetical protein
VKKVTHYQLIPRLRIGRSVTYLRHPVQFFVVGRGRSLAVSNPAGGMGVVSLVSFVCGQVEVSTSG